MQNLEAMRDEIKAAAALSNSAKLLAGYMTATGMFEAKALAEALAIPLRTIQRLKLEIACANSATDGIYSECGTSANDAKHATDGAATCANSAMGGVSEAPNTPPVALVAPTASHARIETPSGLLPHEDRFLDSPPSGPPKAKATPKTERGKRLALDWQLPDQWRKWTRINFAHASDAQIDTEAEKFRDFWHAKAGQGATKLDWQATWRNWCRTAFAPRASAYPINAGRASWDEQRAKRQADTRALMERMGLTSGAMQ